MSTLDSAALWSATSLAFDEKKIGAAGLSVRQRKLLGLLSQPASVSQLAQTIALPDEEVQTALERFAKLGLAQSDAAAPFDPMQLRASKSAAVVEQPSRMPLFIGLAVAALALVAASAWLLRGGSASTAPTPSATSPAPTVQTPTATGPSDNADTTLPRSAATAPAAGTAAAGAAATTTAATAAAVAAAVAAARVPASPAPATVAPVATKAAPTPTTSPAAPAAANVAPTKNSVAPSAEAAAAPAVAAAAPSQPVAAPVVAAPAAAAPAPAAATPSAATVATASPAAAAPRPAPAAAREIKLVSRVEPTFPRGIDADRGTIKARLQVDARGAVTAVEIVEANPPRVFDRTVRSALQQWRYEPTGEAFSTAAEISFSR